MSEPLRILIADDEPLARERIERLLRNERDVQVVGACATGAAAVDAIVRLTPDVVFLDVQMPGLDGFDVIREVGPEHMPAVVFVTAYDHYAIRAFEANALDYLLKPFDDARFARTVARIRQSTDARRIGAAATRLHALLRDRAPATEPASATPAAPHQDRIVIRTGDRVTFLSVDRIDWIGAAGAYARLHVGQDTHLLRMPLQDLELRLDPRQFVRIHRSAIVNLDRVTELREYSRGHFLVRLADGTELKLSRGRRAHLERLLGQSL